MKKVMKGVYTPPQTLSVLIGIRGALCNMSIGTGERYDESSTDSDWDIDD